MPSQTAEFEEQVIGFLQSRRQIDVEGVPHTLHVLTAFESKGWRSKSINVTFTLDPISEDLADGANVPDEVDHLTDGESFAVAFRRKLKAGWPEKTATFSTEGHDEIIGESVYHYTFESSTPEAVMAGDFQAFLDHAYRSRPQVEREKRAEWASVLKELDALSWDVVPIEEQKRVAATVRTTEETLEAMRRSHKKKVVAWTLAYYALGATLLLAYGVVVHLVSRSEETAWLFRHPVVCGLGSAALGLVALGIIKKTGNLSHGYILASRLARNEFVKWVAATRGAQEAQVVRSKADFDRRTREQIELCTMRASAWQAIGEDHGFMTVQMSK